MLADAEVNDALEMVFAKESKFGFGAFLNELELSLCQGHKVLSISAILFQELLSTMPHSFWHGRCEQNDRDNRYKEGSCK